jgi:hypothetical protein
MKFRHKRYRSAVVRSGSSVARFADYMLDTTDRRIQDALGKNPNVEQVVEKKQSKDAEQGD